MHDNKKQRETVLKKAKKRHLERWSGPTGKGKVQTEVWLNPDRSENEKLVENAVSENGQLY